MTRFAVTLAAAAVLTAGALFGASAAHADPYGGPGMCQYLGENYPIYYPCSQSQPWLPYGTADNPPNGSTYLPGQPDPFTQ